MKRYGNSQFDWKSAPRVTISVAREKSRKSPMNGRSPRLLGQQLTCWFPIRCTKSASVQTPRADGFLSTLRKTTVDVGAQWGIAAARQKRDDITNARRR